MTANYNSLFKYLEKEQITTDKPAFIFQLQSHPDYRNLLAITNS